MTGGKYQWLVRGRTDSRYGARYNLAQPAPRPELDHPMHSRSEWQQLMPAGTILVNSVMDTQTCLKDSSGSIYKRFHCSSEQSGLVWFKSKPMCGTQYSGTPWCARWWCNASVGLDEQLDVRAAFSIPDEFTVPYTTKRELLAHDLEFSPSSDIAAGLTKSTRPSDRFAMGRRDDMAVVFSTLQNYVAGGEEYSQPREMFSAACCEYTQTTAEGRLCYQLTTRSIKFVPMYTDGADFF